MVSIEGLNKADVLAALYNGSRPQGMGFLNYTPEAMSSAEAAEYLKQAHYFDYLKGRVIKVSLKDDNAFSEHLYDRDNGSGAAQACIDTLRVTGVNGPVIREQHQNGVVEAAARAKMGMMQESKTEGGVMTLGLKDVADHLDPAVDKAL